MNARGCALALLMSTMSFAAVAAAQEPGPPVESDAPEVIDEPPPGDEPPPANEPPPETAPAAPPPAAVVPAADAGFGAAGQITVSDDLQLMATQLTYDFQGQNVKTTQIQLRPAVDFFAMPNLSFGGQVVIAYTSFGSSNFGSSDQIELGLFGRVGYSFAMSPTTSIWPRVALGYRHIGGSLSTLPNVTNVVPLEVYVPFVFQLAPHFFIGGGPIVATDLIARGDGGDAPRTTTIGIQSTLGGYFSGL
jgi:hypothetical protein